MVDVRTLEVRLKCVGRFGEAYPPVEGRGAAGFAFSPEWCSA
jgi:hypothetical protein